MTVNQAFLRSIPDKVGVYIFKDQDKKVLYVGKAVSLKKRVRKYFLSETRTKKEKQIQEKTVNIDFLITENEAEALILERNLISRYSPPYNIQFKDDKSYPSLKVTFQNEYPALFITRDLVEDGSRYFGPYASAWGIRRVARYSQRLFGIRNCKEIISDRRTRSPCLNYHIGMCSAPCAKKIEREDYLNSVKQLCMFLDGKITVLEGELTNEMILLAKNLDFEKAALVRDRLNAVKKVKQKQRVTRLITGDMDVVGAVLMEQKACIQLIFVRGGNLLGGKQDIVAVPKNQPLSEVLTGFIEQTYVMRKDIPSKILVSHKLSEPRFIVDWFKRRGAHTTITLPMNDLEEELTNLVLTNAKEKLRMEINKGVPKVLIDLQEIFELEEVPIKIEGIDISNISGEAAVGALVTFSNGKVDKTGYRRYRIKTVSGIDDYAMIREVVRRRYKRIMDEGQRRPNLLLIDGGIGHLRSVVEELEALDLDLPVISIAKQKEEIFIQGQMEPLALAEDSKPFRLIKKVRDEAHRFAISYHKMLRGKKVTKSLLTEIAGIGEVRRKQLLNRFGDIKKLKEASVSEIAKTKGVSHALANRIHQYLKQEEKKIKGNRNTSAESNK
jgi:excinuclease ABC subunit C